MTFYKNSKIKKVNKKKYIVNNCKFEGCKIKSSFGYFNEGKIIYCKKHSLPGMIGLRNKLCSKDGCCKRANYGLIKKEYCSSHKKKNMFLIKTSLKKKLSSYHKNNELCLDQNEIEQEYKSFSKNGLDILSDVCSRLYKYDSLDKYNNLDIFTNLCTI